MVDLRDTCFVLLDRKGEEVCNCPNVQHGWISEVDEGDIFSPRKRRVKMSVPLPENSGSSHNL